MTAAAILMTAAAVTACSADSDSPDTSSKGAEVRVATSDQVEGAVSALVAQSNDQIAVQDFGGATITLQLALDLDPDDGAANFNMGFVLQSTGQDADAMLRYARAVQSDPENARAVYNMGILTEPSDLRAAIALYRRAVRLDPTNAAAYVRLGHALGKVGAAKESARSLREGYRLDPALPGAH